MKFEIYTCIQSWLPSNQYIYIYKIFSDFSKKREFFVLFFSKQDLLGLCDIFK